MTKTINLNDQNKYQNKLKETIEFLDYTENELFSKMICLATLGKWKNWDDNIEIGTVFNFTEEMLRDTGDFNINKLFEIAEKISIIKKEIKEG